MTQYVINIGALPNDGTGDPLRTAFNEVNLNFNQIWAAGLVNSNIQIANNTISTTNTNGNLVLNPNGIGNVVANAHIVPDQTRVRNLGSSTQKWNNVYSQYITVAGDAVISGNLSVTGNIIQIGNIITDAKTIQLANTAGTANAANGSGITVGANDNIATFLFDSADNAWVTNVRFETGNLILTDDRIMDLSGLSVTNADLISGSTSGLTIVPNGNTNATSLFNTYGNIQLFTSNTGSNVKTFTFSYDGNLTLPTNTSSINYANGQPYGSSYGNSNVATFLADFGSNVISTTGNITANTITATSSADLGSLNFYASSITMNDDLWDYVSIAPSGESWAYLQIPKDSVANAQDTRLHNDAGNIEFGTGQFSTSGPSYTWTLDNTGNLSVPVNINFNGGGIQQVVNEDFYTRVSDQEDDGWSLYQVVDDGTTDYARTQLERGQYTITVDIPGTAPQWSFDQQSRLNLPGNINGVYGGDTSFYAYDNGTSGSVELKTISYAGDTLGSNVRVTQNNATISTGNVAYTWTFDNTGNLTVPGISTGAGTGEISAIHGTRRTIGITNDPNYGYATNIPGHTTFGNVAYTASTSLVQSARVTFAVQSNGTAYCWEQFDVAICRLDGANAFVSVSNRVRSNDAINYTEVEGYVNEGGALEIWLNSADGQTIALVNYDAVEFNIMVD